MTAAVATPADVVRTIVARRRALGVSQAQLAELIRAGRVTIARYETGARRMPASRVQQAEAALTVLEISFQMARQAAGRAGQP